MKKFAFLLLFAAAAAGLMSQSATQAVNMAFADRYVAAAATGESGEYDFDKNHTFIGFKVRHMGLIDVPGYFRDFTGKVTYDAKDVSKSSVQFTAKVTSVDTGVAGRDNHLRNADFFEVEKYPEITFKSTKVEMKDKKWFVTGDFTMKGVTKTITFPFDIAGWLPGNNRNAGTMGVTAQTSLNRRDYGINYGQTLPSGIAALSDDIKIDLQIEANKKLPPPPAPAAAIARP